MLFFASARQVSGRLCSIKLLAFFLVIVCSVQAQGVEALINPTVDGSKTPELIPDDIAYKVAFLCFSQENDADSTSFKRTRAFLKRLTLSAKDEALLSDTSQQFRKSYKQLIQETRSASVPEKYEQAKALVQASNEALQEAGISAEATATIKKFVDLEKQNIKLFPIPEMTHVARRDSFWNGLLAWFSPHVYAQMSPTGSTWSDVAMDTSGSEEGSSGNVLYTYAGTDAPGCSCHTVYTHTTMTSQSGRVVYGFSDPPSGMESAYVTTVMPLQESDANADGNFISQTDHYAYCPIINQAFISDISYISLPLKKVVAYYYYTGSANDGHGVYKRCTPMKSVCDACVIILGSGTPWQYGLFGGYQLDVRNTQWCVMKALSYKDRCYSPDPVP